MYLGQEERIAFTPLHGRDLVIYNAVGRFLKLLDYVNWLSVGCLILGSPQHLKRSS